MTQPNWGLAQNGFQNALAMGLQLGQMQRQKQMQEQEMKERQEDRQLRRDQMGAQQRAQQLQDAREKLTLMGRLMEGATPEDYGQRLQAAQGMGLDVSKVPPQFDPHWLAQSQMQVRALLGQVEQELMAVAPGTTVIDKRTGKQVYQNPRPPRYIPVQAGGKLVLDPSSVTHGQNMPASAGGGDDEWETIEGGSGGNVGGGFPY